jgi:hypothetical protein
MQFVYECQRSAPGRSQLSLFASFPLPPAPLLWVVSQTASWWAARFDGRLIARRCRRCRRRR